MVGRGIAPAYLFIDTSKEVFTLHHSLVTENPRFATTILGLRTRDFTFESKKSAENLNLESKNVYLQRIEVKTYHFRYKPVNV